MAQDSPYLKPGRLSDVLAALQIMAAGQRPEGTINWWSAELSKNSANNQVERWTAVFREHPEFFLVYSLDGETALKAALRWRYTNKRYDHKTGKEYTQEDKEKLPKAQQELLTTKPLDADATTVLLKTAIELHTRALEEKTARVWWVAPSASFVGALLGAFIAFYGTILTIQSKAVPAAQPAATAPANPTRAN